MFDIAVAGCEHGAGGGGGGGGPTPGGRGADTIRRVKVKMSSVSAQGVVERASAELSRRITGLGLRGGGARPAWWSASPTRCAGPPLRRAPRPATPAPLTPTPRLGPVHTRREIPGKILLVLQRQRPTDARASVHQVARHAILVAALVERPGRCARLP
ncbi:hypothetical protein MSG28_005134 [Choristoneura fumiferana]|uniref:Uncharacterized protein n=1 Tax=Choristoneura fumiferana TaxID=7141 RepID=A0ACC0JQ83_CHOFU|nr:hypothetical protein MSG28_005134 [Choristoneura fumiferana]